MEQKVSFAQKEAIKIWKKLKVDVCEFEFDCGGDSFNDYRFDFKSNGKLIKKGKKNGEDYQTLETYFDNAVFKEVDFYEASDGHYIGERGIVYIELNEEDDEPTFTYLKTSVAQFDETISNIVMVKLNKNELNFIKNNVSSIFGEEGGGDCDFTYKRDFILTDSDERLIKVLSNKLFNSVTDVEIETEGELNEWYNFMTSDERNDDVDLKELTITDNHLLLLYNRSVTIYRDSDEW